MSEESKQRIRGSVHLRSDGLQLAPADYAHLFVELTQPGTLISDLYLSGGAISELENQFAAKLGKARAVYLPTGVLANQLALRAIAGSRRRVFVQAESHIFKDAADGVQRLSDIRLVPFLTAGDSLTLADLTASLNNGSDSSLPNIVGAISLECPIRRLHGAVIDIGEISRIAKFARENGIHLHLDGARLFVAGAYTGVSPASYAAHFDTVYVSLYKCFNASGGAILAGPADVIERVLAERKVFGGELHHGWPDAAVALHYLDGFEDRFQRAVEVARQLFELLNAHPRFHVESVPKGTNVFRLHVRDIDPDSYVDSLARAGLKVRIQSAGTRFQGVWLLVNESLNASSPADIAQIFFRALPS